MAPPKKHIPYTDDIDLLFQTIEEYFDKLPINLILHIYGVITILFISGFVPNYEISTSYSSLGHVILYEQVFRDDLQEIL